MDHLDIEMVRAPPGAFRGLKYRDEDAESIAPWRSGLATQWEESRQEMTAFHARCA